MRFLILLAVLVGCKSTPVQYEMIEVNDAKLSNMRGLIQREKQALLFEMHYRDASRERPGRGLPSSCRAIPRQARPLLAASGIDVGGSATAERRTTAGDHAAIESIGLPAVDQGLPKSQGR